MGKTNVSPEVILSTKNEEGLRLKAYQDTKGVWTIGYGTNLQTLEISQEQADRWMMEKLESIADRLDSYPPAANLSQARKDVLIEMAYNLGWGGLLKFKKMWAAIELQDWKLAAVEILDSEAGRDLRKRYTKLARRFQDG